MESRPPRQSSRSHAGTEFNEIREIRRETSGIESADGVGYVAVVKQIFLVEREFRFVGQNVIRVVVNFQTAFFGRVRQRSSVWHRK